MRLGADLLSVRGTAAQVALEGLAESRVEGLEDVVEQDRHRQNDRVETLHPLQGILAGSLQDHGCRSHALAEGLKSAFWFHAEGGQVHVAEGTHLDDLLGSVTDCL